MDYIFDKSYKEASLLMRYAVLLFNVSSSRRDYAKKLVDLANSLKFQAYPLTLISQDNTSFLDKDIRQYLTSVNSEKLVLEMNQKDSHFVDSVGLSDIERESANILDTINNFYKTGNFEKLNRACYRFLKRITKANEYDLNDGVLRYMVSCICLNDYTNCFNIIETISENYSYFDYNIYLFFLNMVHGEFEDSSKYLLKIMPNVPDGFSAYVTEEDMAFYLSLILLLNFRPSLYKGAISQNETLIYILYDKYPQYFSIVDDYYKCDYLKLCTDFDKILEKKIKKDPLLAGYANTIENKLKIKLLKEILSFTSEISFETIKELLSIKSNKMLEEMLTQLISKEGFPALIDDISGTVIMEEKDPTNEALIKSNQIIKKNINKLIQNSITKNIKNKVVGKSIHHNNHISYMETSLEDLMEG